MMIDTIAKRRTTLNGKTYEKGEKVPMPLQQFTDLEPTGRFERAPAAPKAASKPSSKSPSRRSAPKASGAEPVTPASDAAPVSKPSATKAD